MDCGTTPSGEAPGGGDHFSAADSATLQIVNARGLHARASAKFVTLAETYDADITVECGSQSVSACSLMGLMMLGAGRGSSITLHATGRQAAEALTALSALVRAGFNEDD